MASESIDDAGVLELGEIQQRNEDQRLRPFLHDSKTKLAIDFEVNRLVTVRAFRSDRNRQGLLP